MPEYEITQLIEVSYRIEAPDEDTAVLQAETFDWDVSAWDNSFDIDPYSGGTILSVSQVT